jgi:aerobic carbon-monoxide dehydrogenase medium subunit
MRPARSRRRRKTGEAVLKAPAFSYIKAATLGELLDVLDRYGEDARILAGGQSLMPALNMRLSSPQVLVDINAIGELAGIRVSGDSVTIGALTRHREVERSEIVARHLSLLHQAMPHVAHAAIRNRGTFGGSIANADPAAELPACSLALGVRFRIVSKRGERTLAAQDFFTGLYETALKPGDVLVAGDFPVVGDGYRSSFHELARRHGDYPLVGLAAHAKASGNTLSDLRLAYFGAGATPLLARTAAGVLEKAPYSAALLKDAQAALDTDLSPFGDVSCSSETRRHFARVLLARAVAKMTGVEA